MKTRRTAALLTSVGLFATTLVIGPAVALADEPAITEASCLAIADVEVSAAEIDLPTTGAVVTSTEWVVETNGQCRVIGEIAPVDPEAPPITFQVNLPDNWNGRALQMGGGGLNGKLIDATGPYRYQPSNQATPLQDGFVTLGSDGGHQGGGGSFALNDEALLNYGQQSIKKTHDVAMALMNAAYEQEPDWFYFVGFSQGGHEALDAAGRYSDDYDGVVAGTPAYNVTMMHLGVGSVYRDALYGGDPSAWLSPEKQDLVVESVYAACDPIDGLADGIISDTEGCLEAFDIATLRCDDGSDLGNDCLSDTQIATITKLASYTDIGIDIAGNSVAAPMPILNGGLLNKGRYHLGLSPEPSNPAAGSDAWHFQVLDTIAKYMITKNPNLETVDFDIAEYEERIQELGEIMDTTSVDFSPAHESGTKVLLYTGMSDDGISPYNTIQFYDRLVNDMGQAKVDEFMKFYTVPGLSHGFGPFVPGIETFPALMDWVENGVAPGTLTAVDENTATVGRERPVCAYPSWPEYQGGDENQASSFECVEQASETDLSAPVIETPVDGTEVASDEVLTVSGTGIDGAVVDVTLQATGTSGNDEPIATASATVVDGQWSVQFEATLPAGGLEIVATQSLGDLVSDSAVVSVVVLSSDGVTPPVSTEPATSEPATTSPAPGDPGGDEDLASTGGEDWWAIGGALAALLMLAGLALLRRRARTSE